MCQICDYGDDFVVMVVEGGVKINDGEMIVIVKKVVEEIIQVFNDVVEKGCIIYDDLMDYDYQEIVGFDLL